MVARMIVVVLTAFLVVGSVVAAIGVQNALRGIIGTRKNWNICN